jgi:protein TonB
VRAAAPAAPAAASPAPPVQNAASTNTAPGDPRAKKAELDYFSQISAHLNRRKSYPAEAKKARQEGVVVIRFTVDRAGAVSGAGIKRGSGHEILDSATLLLLQRVAPLPRMPAMMQRDSVTLSLPIDYSLKTD